MGGAILVGGLVLWGWGGPAELARETASVQPSQAEAQRVRLTRTRELPSPDRATPDRRDDQEAAELDALVPTGTDLMLTDPAEARSQRQQAARQAVIAGLPEVAKARGMDAEAISGLLSHLERGREEP